MATTMAMDMAMRRAIQPDPKSGDRRGSQDAERRWLEISVIAILCTMALLLTCSVGIAGVIRERSPALALKLWPWDARALAVQADNLLMSDPTKSDFALAKSFAEKSIARDPTSAPALRVLGFVQENSGNIAAARVTIRTSEKLSRRDLAGQLWLINDAVVRDEAEEALGHFDTALRTSDLAPPMLLPILANATEDASLIAPLAAVLAKQPPWGLSFVAEAIYRGPAPQNLVLLDQALRNRGVPLSQPLVQQLINQLVALNRFSDALTIYNRATGKRDEGNLLRDGRFDRDPQLSPFDWSISPEDSLFVSRAEAGEGVGGHRLTFTAPSGGYGDLVRQLLVLVPGKYRVSVDADVERANIHIAIRCAEYPRRGLLESPPTNLSLSADFAVPANGCKAQWLAIVVNPVKNLDGATGWVGNVMLAADGPR